MQAGRHRPPDPAQQKIGRAAEEHDQRGDDPDDRELAAKCDWRGALEVGRHIDLFQHRR